MFHASAVSVLRQLVAILRAPLALAAHAWMVCA
jgi:hypothetical protein